MYWLKENRLNIVQEVFYKAKSSIEAVQMLREFNIETNTNTLNVISHKYKIERPHLKWGGNRK